MAETEDEDFLSLVAAAEAEAINSAKKRRKITIHNNAEPNLKKENEEQLEGAYIAALKGSKSALWQQKIMYSSGNSAATVNASNRAAIGNFESDGGGGLGSCFKCGKSGHWARDCDVVGGGGPDSSVPVKDCRCGLGACLVLTANTEKNRGRKFYKCPVREENGGCGFFEWCDNSSGTINNNIGNQSYASNSSLPDLPCPCGAGSCLILTAKTGKNIGQQFYRCPANQGSSCGYFKWCNDQNEAVSATNIRDNMNETSNKSYSVTGGSSCFKCGKEGHWAKDCPVLVSDSRADSGGRSASSGTCYKCGMPGHWARDCPSVQNMNARQRF